MALPTLNWIEEADIPPALSPGSGRFHERQKELDAEVAVLRTRPGNWVLIRTGVTAKLSGFKPPYVRRGCEAIVRPRSNNGVPEKNKAGQVLGDLYVRYPAKG